MCGRLWAKRDWSDQILDDPLYGTDFGSYITRGVLGGAQASCDHQIGAGVFGIQVDYGWSNASGSNVLLAALAPPLLTRSVAASVVGVGYRPNRR